MVLLFKTHTGFILCVNASSVLYVLISIVLLLIYCFRKGQVFLFCLFCFLFFSVRLVSVLRGHSVSSSPPQRPMTSDFEGFSIPDCIHYIYFPILILEKEPVLSPGSSNIYFNLQRTKVRSGSPEGRFRPLAHLCWQSTKSHVGCILVFYITYII